VAVAGALLRCVWSKWSSKLSPFIATIIAVMVLAGFAAAWRAQSVQQLLFHRRTPSTRRQKAKGDSEWTSKRI